MQCLSSLKTMYKQILGFSDLYILKKSHRVMRNFYLNIYHNKNMAGLMLF